MTCDCGCGERPSRGAFLPRHDQRLRAELEKRVGGLLQMHSLVEAAEGYSAGEVAAADLARRFV
jgi:hypothetical protein